MKKMFEHTECIKTRANDGQPGATNVNMFISAYG